MSHVGITAGGIYAVATLGSLVGTLGAAWLFLYMPITLGFIGMSLLVVLPALLIRPGPGAVSLLFIGSVLGYQMLATGPVHTMQVAAWSGRFQLPAPADSFSRSLMTCRTASLSHSSAP